MFTCIFLHWVHNICLSTVWTGRRIWFRGALAVAYSSSAPPLWVPDFDLILPSGANPFHLSAPTTSFFLRAIVYPQAHSQSSLIKLRLFCNSQKRCFQAHLFVWCMQFQCLLSPTVQVTVTILPRSVCQSVPYPDLKWPLKYVLSGELRSIQNMSAGQIEV